MNQYLIEPEVPGGIGKNTVGNFDVNPPVVEKLHLEFEGWLGDDLLEAFPCFLVSENLATALVASKLSGYNLEAVELSTSEIFQELQPECCLPSFSWLQIAGHIGTHDFSVSEKGSLIVSRKAMQLMLTLWCTKANKAFKSDSLRLLVSLRSQYSKRASHLNAALGLQGNYGTLFYYRKRRPN